MSSGRLTSSAPAPPAFAWSQNRGHQNVRLSGQQTGSPASFSGISGYSIKGDICTLQFTVRMSVSWLRVTLIMQSPPADRHRDAIGVVQTLIANNLVILWPLPATSTTSFSLACITAQAPLQHGLPSLWHVRHLTFPPNIVDDGTRFFGTRVIVRHHRTSANSSAIAPISGRLPLSRCHHSQRRTTACPHSAGAPPVGFFQCIRRMRVIHHHRRFACAVNTSIRPQTGCRRAAVFSNQPVDSRVPAVSPARAAGC